MSDQPSVAGPLARIDRADELVADLEAALKAFLATQPYMVEERPDDNPAVRTFVITALRDIRSKAQLATSQPPAHRWQDGRIVAEHSVGVQPALRRSDG